MNTGKNEVLEDILRIATDDIIEKLYSLLQGSRTIARIDQNVVYRSLIDNPENVYSLLLTAGYLKAPIKQLQADGTYLCEVAIPNKEIASVYKNEILSHLMQIGAISRTTSNKIAESIYANNWKQLQSAIEEYLNQSISYYDFRNSTVLLFMDWMLGLICINGVISTKSDPIVNLVMGATISA